MDEREVQEERTEHLIQVRRVTDLHAAWTEGERGAPGAFTLQTGSRDNSAGSTTTRSPRLSPPEDVADRQLRGGLSPIRRFSTPSSNVDLFKSRVNLV